MHHRWLLEQLGDDANVVNKNMIQPSSRRSITFKKYIAMQKLKKAALGYIAANLSETEVGSLGDIFHLLDKDRDGFLTLSDLDSAISKGALPRRFCRCLLMQDLFLLIFCFYAKP
jgi:calcium-dependent protein kinase